MWRCTPSHVLGAFMVLSTGCAPGIHSPHEYAPPGEQLILPDEIARSGASTAWDVVLRSSHMSTISTADGEPARMWLRGRGSVYIRETPIVVVDGVESLDIQILSQIRADRIAWMRVLTGSASAARFGTDGGAGAVIVQTWGAEQDVASEH